MKKWLSILMVVLMSAVMLTGCGNSDQGKKETTKAQKGQKVLLLLNGTRGDKSFFDSAAAGIEKAKQEFGLETKIIEMGNTPADQPKWEPTLAEVSEEDWDLIIVGTYQMQEVLAKVAPQYPKKKYVIFDSSLDFKSGKFPNVYAITYKQNEASYLAGSLAGKMSKTNKIGFIGGMDIPVINDFMLGFVTGAKAANPNIKATVSYIGNFNDSAKGKEIGLAQYNQGTDIIFQAASQAGLGVVDAAKESKKFAIGVDSDQAMFFKDSNPEKANLILTSVMKRIDNSLLRTLKLFLDGKLPFGTEESLGIKEKAVGLAENELYNKNIPEDVRKYVTDVQAKILNDQIKVDTAFGMDNNKLNEIKNTLKP